MTKSEILVQNVWEEITEILGFVENIILLEEV